MKRILFFTLSLFLCVQAHAQSPNFGVTAGYLHLDATSSYRGFNASVSDSGFYLGAFAEFDITPTIILKPGLNYGKVEDSDGVLFIPVMAKMYIADSDFNLQAGPQASIVLEETGDNLNTVGIDGSFGAGYDINENFLIEARYSFELTNRISSLDGIPNDVKARVNSLIIGVGYKF